MSLRAEAKQSRSESNSDCFGTDVPRNDKRGCVIATLFLLVIGPFLLSLRALFYLSLRAKRGNLTTPHTGLAIACSYR